jgi:glycosyltransferase involved in cell wall biosynthesis
MGVLSRQRGQRGTEPDGNWPAVSVVVPTRDRPELLARALVSILGQRYPGPIECIVVFDGKQDKLPSVETGERRSLRVLVNTRTPGPAGARNTGALAATGDFLAFCDDDDAWISDKVRLQVQALQRNGEAEVVACGVLVHYGGRTTARVADETITLDQLVRSRTIQAHFSTIMVRRGTFLDQVGLIDETFPGSYSEDYDWMLRAAARKSIVAVPRPLVHRYFHASSFFDSRWDLVAQAEQCMLAKHPELLRDRRGLARIYGRLAFAKAASGSNEARAMALRTFALDWRQPRAYLALLVSARIVSPDTLLRLTQRFGRGI